MRRGGRRASATNVQAGRTGCVGAILGGIAGVVGAAALYRYLRWDPAMTTLVLAAAGAMLGARIAQALAARGGGGGGSAVRRRRG